MKIDKTFPLPKKVAIGDSLDLESYIKENGLDKKLKIESNYLLVEGFYSKTHYKKIITVLDDAVAIMAIARKHDFSLHVSIIETYFKCKNEIEFLDLLINRLKGQTIYNSFRKGNKTIKYSSETSGHFRISNNAINIEAINPRTGSMFELEVVDLPSFSENWLSNHGLNDLELREIEPENNDEFDSLNDIPNISSEGACPNCGGTTHDYLCSCGYDAWSNF